MVTLYGYVLRELLKTFGLTLLALTALFTLGGGLYNVLKYEGVGAGDLFGFLPMLVPIVLAMVMPIAALFAVTMVYGRLANDNELQACRASGINIHRLFLPALLLSVFVAAFSLMFSDLVVPDLTRRVDGYARANLRDIAFTKFQVSGYVRYERDDGERWLVTAKRVQIPGEQALRKQKLPVDEEITYLLVEEPRFLRIDQNDRIMQFTSARHGLCQFDARRRPLEVTLFVDQARDFDVRGRSVQLKRQQLGPFLIPLEFPRKASMVDLATLSRWRQQPWLVDKLRPDEEAFERLLETQLLYDYCATQVDAHQPIALVDEGNDAWQLTAGDVRLGEKGMWLSGVRLSQVGGDPGRPLYLEAPTAMLRTRPTIDRRTVVELRLEGTADVPVREHNPRASDYEAGRPRASFLPEAAFLIPAFVVREMQEYTPARIFDPAEKLPIPVELAEKRTKLLDKAALQQRKMATVIHFRLGYSSSVLVTIVMAAALGVIFRGARALAAFALGCIPFACVGILMAMGRQLGEKEATQMLSPILTWGGLAALAVADIVILRLGVRR